jgi:flavin-binding protein dodecin
MAESVYRVTELVGTSSESWEKAASAAVTAAGRTLRDLRIAKVVELDMQIEEGQVVAYRARLKISFKFEGQGE